MIIIMIMITIVVIILLLSFLVNFKKKKKKSQRFLLCILSKNKIIWSYNHFHRASVNTNDCREQNKHK